MKSKLILLVLAFVTLSTAAHATNGNTIRLVEQRDGNYVAVETSMPSLDYIAIDQTATINSLVVNTVNGSVYSTVTEVTINRIEATAASFSTLDGPLDASSVGVTFNRVEATDLKATNLEGNLDGTGVDLIIRNIDAASGTVSANLFTIANQESLRVTAAFCEDSAITININVGGVMTQYLIPVKVLAAE